jgi:ribosomal protein S18 acetylase RimI-like enzyme
VQLSQPTVRRFAPHEWRVYRALRLQALRDAPDAFGSTLAREEAFPEEEWLSRLERGADSTTDLPLIVEDDARPIGLAWARIDSDDPEIAALYQVWVDPAYRNHGVGRLLIDAALDWARSAGARQVLLSVALGPTSALEFYQRLGFVEIGEPVPLRSDSRSLKQTMRLMLGALALVVLAMPACSSASERAPQQPDSATTRVVTPGAPAARDSSRPSTPGPATAAKPSPPYTVTEHGIGPLRAGMTYDEAAAALDGALRVPVGVDTAGCDYLVWSDGPSGVHVMFDEHRIARIDVDTSGIATAAGARIGDDEARIKKLYPGQVKVSPHKYEDGHYLTVTPAEPADKQFRIIFETARGRVIRYRAGRMPSVEYVEGCS